MEQIANVLKDLGISRIEAEIYTYLSISGSQRAKDIAEGLHLSRPKVYNSLKRLRNRGAIVINRERSKSFSACSLEKLLKSKARNRLDKAESFEKNKQKILSTRNELMKKSNLGDGV